MGAFLLVLKLLYAYSSSAHLPLPHSEGKESICSVGDLGSIPGLGRSPGGGHLNPLQYSCLENPHGQRSLAGYSTWGSQIVGHHWATKHSTAQIIYTYIHIHTHTYVCVRMYIYIERELPCWLSGKESACNAGDTGNLGLIPESRRTPAGGNGNPLQYVAAAAAKSLQSCLTLCDPTDGSPPGSPIPGSLQARTLEWVAISFSNAWKWKVKVKSLSHVLLLATPWTAAHQAPPSMGFSRQEYWRGVPLPPPPLRYTCLKNPMDRGAWRATGPGPTKGQIATEQRYTCVCVFIHTHEQNKKVFASYQRERLGRL